MSVIINGTLCKSFDEVNIVLSESGAIGLGTSLVEWSDNCKAGAHWHLAATDFEDRTQTLGVFVVPGSAELIIESTSDHITDHSDNKLIDTFDTDCSNTIYVESKKNDKLLTGKVKIQLSLDYLSMRKLGEQLIIGQNKTLEFINYSMLKDKYIFVYNSTITRSKLYHRLIISITHDKRIDDYYYTNI